MTVDSIEEIGYTAQITPSNHRNVKEKKIHSLAQKRRKKNQQIGKFLKK